MIRRMQTGFNRRIALPWLERTAQLALAGASRADAAATLDDVLMDRLAVGGSGPGNAREKTINILLKIWVNPPVALVPLRDDGLRLLQRLPRQHHLAIHWGMTMAVYPFFGLVADVVGRLLRLQG